MILKVPLHTFNMICLNYIEPLLIDKIVQVGDDKDIVNRLISGYNILIYQRVA